MSVRGEHMLLLALTHTNLPVLTRLLEGVSKDGLI